MYSYSSRLLGSPQHQSSSSMNERFGCEDYDMQGAANWVDLGRLNRKSYLSEAGHCNTVCCRG